MRSIKRRSLRYQSSVLSLDPRIFPLNGPFAGTSLCPRPGLYRFSPSGCAAVFSAVEFIILLPIIARFYMKSKRFL